MRKLVRACSLAAALGLAACGGGDSSDGQGGGADGNPGQGGQGGQTSGAGGTSTGTGGNNGPGGGTGGQSPGAGGSGSGGSASGGSAQGGRGTGGRTQTGGAGQSGGTTQTGGTTAAGEPPKLAGIVEAHNVERRTLGEPDLVWDPALAKIAQAWAEKCVDTTAPVGLLDHNPNRAAGYPGTVGENIYGTDGTASVAEGVGGWIAEKADYNYGNNTCAPNKLCGHYTQVVWKATLKIGCGTYRCANLKYADAIVCDYSPAGNIIGQKPY